MENTSAAIREHDLRCRRLDEDLALRGVGYLRGRFLFSGRLLDNLGCRLRGSLSGSFFRFDDIDVGLRRRHEERLIPVKHGKRQQDGDENPAFHVVDLRAWDRVVPVSPERPAARQPDHAEPDATANAVNAHRFRHVIRA